MAREFSRTRRIGEQIQRELAELIQREIKDPRLGMVTVAGVEVSRDLAHAKVYVTLLGGSEDIELTLSILQHAAGFLRRELGRRMSMRTVPELRFVYDASIAEGNRISALIDQALAADKGKEDTGDN